jgi:hypothetical protein
MQDTQLIPTEVIEHRILIIRNRKVILDSELAIIYGVSTRRLNQQFRRNLERFPDDFAFLLTKEEYDSLMLQIATSKKGRGGRRKLPIVFTEHGALMAANVLNSKHAVRMSVYVVRAFIKLRETFATHKELAYQLAELERKYQTHDTQIKNIIEAIRKLMEPPTIPPKRPIGFHVGEPQVKYNAKIKTKQK